MLEFIEGCAFGIGSMAVLVPLIGNNIRARNQETIDRIARSIVTMYGRHSLSVLNEACYYLTGYSRNHPITQKIILKIPEIQRQMDEEEKIRKELEA